MEFVEGKLYVTADIDADLVAEMHIQRWYKPGLPCEYVRKHRRYHASDPPEQRRHVVKITLDGHYEGVSFWVFECVIKERCVWNFV